MDDYIREQIIKCRRKIMLDEIDIWYKLLEIEILSSEDDLDAKMDKIYHLKGLHILKINEIDKRLREIYNEI